MNIHTIANLNKEQDDLHYIGVWENGTDSIPIYHADSPHSFNRVIGYARYINSTSGTVVYRGQNNLHPHLLPSGARPGKTAVAGELFDDIAQNYEFSKFLGLERPEIKGWKEYSNMLVEAVLQHYGSNTFCMDFVDNHWCALWFGLYKFENNHYHVRNDEGNLYVFLYLAETEGPCVGGMYIGEDTYTIDLRKALPSTFQRPASQHGWIVRKKERKATNLDDGVVGVIEVSVNDAKKWLGNGQLLSEENFFPSFDIDQGYKVLLSRQHRSGLYLNKALIIPQNTICNYHLHQMFYCSDIDKLIKIKLANHAYPKIDIENPLDLFAQLLDRGWAKNTCATPANWHEETPYVGQSASTAVLLQKLFGGDICYINYAAKVHYFNIIDKTIIDLTYRELESNIAANCYMSTNYSILKPGRRSVHDKNCGRVANLLRNLMNN